MYKRPYLTLKSRWICSKMSSRLLRRITCWRKPPPPTQMSRKSRFSKKWYYGEFRNFHFQNLFGIGLKYRDFEKYFFFNKKIFILVKILLKFNGVKLNFFDFFAKISEFLRFLNRVKCSEIMTFFCFFRKKHHFYEKVTVI